MGRATMCEREGTDGFARGWGVKGNDRRANVALIKDAGWWVYPGVLNTFVTRNESQLE